MSVVIAQATLKDIPRLHAIEAAVYPPDLAESPAVLASRIQVAPQFCAIATLDGACVGYVLAHPWPDHSSPGLGNTLETLPENSDVIHLHDLAVLPTQRGLGVARLLLEWLEIQLPKHGFSTTTLVAVNGADVFWTAMGFQNIGPASGYDAVARMMRRERLK